MKFQIGDRVISKKNDSSNGLSGVILRLDNRSLLLKMDGNFDGHDGGGGVKTDGHGCWIASSEAIQQDHLVNAKEIISYYDAVTGDTK